MDAFGITPAETFQTIVTATGVYLGMILLSRVFGQRQFSRMSTYDMPFAFALGTLVGRVILVRTSLAGAWVGLATMFVLHAVSGWLHHNVTGVHRLVQNRPELLVAGGRVVEQGLRRVKTSRVELNEQLRLAGVSSLEDVAAVVMERTGELSVIRAGRPIDPRLFQDVRGADRL